MEKVNIAEKFGKIRDYWKPCIAAELNGQLVKLDKLKGEFVWHRHDREDELFLVVPRGVEHRPVADEEAWVVLFEPASTHNTGNVQNELSLEELERI